MRKRIMVAGDKTEREKVQGKQEGSTETQVPQECLDMLGEHGLVEFNLTYERTKKSYNLRDQDTQEADMWVIQGQTRS